MLNILLIPDGLRRWARAHNQTYEDNYIAGARKMFSDLLTLLGTCGVVGAFPLAAYNLNRSAHEADALLQGLLSGLTEFLRSSPRHVVVVGNTDLLLSRLPELAKPLQSCDLNPHRRGSLSADPGSLVLYLCYDGLQLLRELTSLYSDEVLQSRQLRWDAVFRTGCEHNLFRFSSVIPGTEQARLACTAKLFQDVRPGEMIAPFEPLRS